MMLLAKSPSRDGSRKGLADHGKDVMDACEALFGTARRPSRFAGAWLRFFGLSQGTFPVFIANTLAACGLHDLGKATDSFQGAVTQGTGQAIRHEHMSALILVLPRVDAWLRTGLDADLVVSAVAGHHLKANDQGTPAYPAIGEPWTGFGAMVELLVGAPDLAALFDATALRTGLPPADFELPELWSFSNGPGQSIPDRVDRLRERFSAIRRQLRRDPGCRALFMAVKSALVVADSAGSGLAREGLDSAAWLEPLFTRDALLTADAIRTGVIDRRVRQIETRKRETDPDYRFQFQDFQDRAAALPPRALMLASCGAGKTLAAWRWIEAQLAREPRGRVLFLYPTRATATEGFRDYVSHAPETDASLLTGTARYELQDLFENPEDGRAYLTEERLYALGYWSKRVFSATVDQFLGFMQQVYRGVCLLPVLADSILVFDEVHSYDVGLFDALKKFLAHFDVPALCMTASLPVSRRAELEGLGLHLFTGAGLPDLDRLSNLPRYRIERLENRQEAESIARQACGEGKRVLWVVNTVDRCQELAQALGGLEPLCYHSRFTLDDRKRRHAAVIGAFQSDDSPGRIAVTTQVCEMSLDLDAQVLITEQAPIPALIQRMGRCNRHAQPGSDSPGEVYLYPPPSAAPYGPDETEAVPGFVAAIRGQTVSQTQLEELLERFTRSGGNEADRWAAFLDDGPWARGGVEELRDGPDFTVQAVLDPQAYLRLRARGKPTDGLVLPVPRYMAQADRRLPRHLRLAPPDHYDPELGFMKQPIRQGVPLA